MLCQWMSVTIRMKEDKSRRTMLLRCCVGVNPSLQHLGSFQPRKAVSNNTSAGIDTCSMEEVIGKRAIWGLPGKVLVNMGHK